MLVYRVKNLLVRNFPRFRLAIQVCEVTSYISAQSRIQIRTLPERTRNDRCAIYHTCKALHKELFRYSLCFVWFVCFAFYYKSEQRSIFCYPFPLVLKNTFLSGALSSLAIHMLTCYKKRGARDLPGNSTNVFSPMTCFLCSICLFCIVNRRYVLYARKLIRVRSHQSQALTVAH